MTLTSTSPQRIERGCFRTRSVDADWDFFPFGHWGPGYRVSAAQRHRLEHSGWSISLFVALLLDCAANFAAIEHIDYNNLGNVVFLLLVSVTPVLLFVTARWLCVWRLPPAERPLTLHEVQAFRARAHGRDKVLATIVVSATTAVFGLLLCGYAVTLEATTEGMRISWFLALSQGSFIVGCALCAWRAYGVLRLQPPAATGSQET